MESKITNIVADLLGIEVGQVVPEASIMDDLGADEEDMIALIAELEQIFDITIADEETYDIRSVQDAIDCIQKKL